MKRCECGELTFDPPCPICRKLAFYVHHYPKSVELALAQREEQDDNRLSNTNRASDDRGRKQ
jgi:hypothetical protein